MTPYLKRNLVLGLSCLSIVACSDDSDSSSDSRSAVSDSELLALIEESNYADRFPYLADESTGLQINQRGLVRFDTTSKIPLYYVSDGGHTPPTNISNAITNLENRLGDIFTDFTLINEDISTYKDLSRPTENVGNGNYDEATFKGNHGIIGGLVISEGSGYYDSGMAPDPQSMCANASIAPYSGGISIQIYGNTHTYTETTLMWANLGNGQCSWDSDIVVHEIAHAMGMFKHVDHDHFGKWGSTAMDMLDTMYKNLAGTPFNALTPSRG